MRSPCALALVLCATLGWPEGNFAQEAEREKPDATSALYKLQMLKIGNTYQGLKYKPTTGEAWQIVVDKWEKVSETGPCPAGEYQITLIPGETGFQAIRMDRQTGMTSLLSNGKWKLVKEPVRAEPVPTKKAVHNAKAYELRHVRVGNQLHVLRFHPATGTVAHITGEAYEEYPEVAGAIPRGQYEVTMMATKDTWMAFRFDHASGATWMLRANRWERVADPE